MKISTKGRYALRMLVDLAQHQSDGYIALKDIAARQHISKKYLEQIVPLLNNSNMLMANRGFQGGYRLAGEAKNYSVGDVLRLTEGSLAPIACLECNPKGCEHVASCATFPMWEGLHKVIVEYLDGVTIQDLVDNNRTIGADSYII